MAATASMYSASPATAQHRLRHHAHTFEFAAAQLPPTRQRIGPLDEQVCSIKLRASVVCVRTASSAVEASKDRCSRPSIALHAAAGVGLVSSSSRSRASAAHGELLSRLRYSVHALLRVRGQRQRGRRERAVEPRFAQRRIETARAIRGRQRARQIVGTQAEPRAFELHGRDVAQIPRVGGLLARRRQQRLRRIVVTARQQLRDAERVQLRRRFTFAE